MKNMFLRNSFFASINNIIMDKSAVLYILFTFFLG